MSTRALALRSGLAAVLLAVALGVTAQIRPSPQEPAPPAGQGPALSEAEMQNARALMLEMQQLQEQLGEIQERAVAAHPEVQQQAQAFQDALVGAMQREGYDPRGSLAHIESIEQQIEQGNLSEQERQTLIQELRDEHQQLVQAEEAALQHPQVQQAREDFVMGMLNAMREEAPETDRLIEQLMSKNQELNEIVTAEAEPLE